MAAQQNVPVEEVAADRYGVCSCCFVPLCSCKYIHKTNMIFWLSLSTLSII